MCGEFSELVKSPGRQANRRFADPSRRYVGSAARFERYRPDCSTEMLRDLAVGFARFKSAGYQVIEPR